MNSDISTEQGTKTSGLSPLSSPVLNWFLRGLSVEQRRQTVANRWTQLQPSPPNSHPSPLIAVLGRAVWQGGNREGAFGLAWIWRGLYRLSLFLLTDRPG